MILGVSGHVGELKIMRYANAQFLLQFKDAHHRLLDNGVRQTYRTGPRTSHLQMDGAKMFASVQTLFKPAGSKDINPRS